MKTFSLLVLFTTTAFAVTAQIKTVTQASITTKTTIISPDEDDDAPPPPPPGPGGEERRIVRFGGDGETKSTTTLKGSLVKTYTETEMSRTTVLRDNDKKTTTTLMEMMGNKTGFIATDADQAAMAKRMDSLMQSRNQGSNGNTAMRNNLPQATSINYSDETKKIAGLQCKKAFIIVTRQNGTKDTNTVWYCPDFKLQGIASTGGMSGFGGFGGSTSLNGLNDLAGFPMQYEMKMNRGRKMIVEITKINIDKEVADKEFDIPKDFTIKPVSEMQNGDGRIQIRVGGPPTN